jgi:hypothetical protein
MRLIESCLRCLVVLLKFNFGFVLFLQTTKLLLVNDSNEYTNIPPSLSRSEFTSNNTVSQLPPQNDQSTSSLIKSLLTFYTYDVNQIEATKVDLVNVHNWTKVADDRVDSKPYVTVSSSIKLNEMFQFNNLRNMIKVILVLNLSLTIILINLIILCYLALTRSKPNSLGKLVSSNIVLNLILLVFMLVLNTTFMLMMNKYQKSSSMFSNLNETVFGFVMRYLAKRPNLVDLQNYSLVDSRSMFTTVSDNYARIVAGARLQDIGNSSGLDGIRFVESEQDSVSSFTFLQINIVLMVVTTLLLILYAFFIKSETRSNRSHEEYSKEFREFADIEEQGKFTGIFLNRFYLITG